MPDPVVPQQPVPPPAPPVPPPAPPVPPQPPAPKSPSQNFQTRVTAAIAFIILGAILWALYQKGGFFLNSLQDIPVARGLITFLIAITTMGIAIMLAYSTLFGEAAPDDDKTFDRGKQVLSVLIGLLGTIVGFYFGAPTSGGQTKPQGLTIAPARVSNLQPKKGETFTISDYVPDGKPPYVYSITFDPVVIPPIKDIKSESGILEQKITVPDTLSANTDVKYKVHVTDSDNKSADKDGPETIVLKTK
jgi:hypothetical protein